MQNDDIFTKTIIINDDNDNTVFKIEDYTFKFEGENYSKFSQEEKENAAIIFIDNFTCIKDVDCYYFENSKTSTTYSIDLKCSNQEVTEILDDIFNDILFKMTEEKMFQNHENISTSIN